MIKKLLIILVLFLGVVVAAVTYELHSQPQPLTVLSTLPVNRGSQNPFLPLIVTFNRAPTKGEGIISIAPDTKITSKTEGKTIIVTPTTLFLPETEYAVSINTSPPYTFGFTTQTDIENAPGASDAMHKANEQYHQQNVVQDAALASIRKNAPLKENGFTVNYSYAGDTYTIVLSVPYEQNKAAFLNWMEQHGVTDSSNLLINYVNQ